MLTSPPTICPSNVSQDKYGVTALGVAIRERKSGSVGCAEIVPVLRAAGAKAEERDFMGVILGVYGEGRE